MTDSNDVKPRVLFICTGNSARSQIAEALLRHHASDRYDASSAGIEPQAEVHPLALRVLDEAGVDTTGLHPKDTWEFLGRVPVTYAIAVCSKAQQNCPRSFPFTTRNFYWPFDDPSAVEGTVAERLAVFRRTRDEIDARIQLFLKEDGH